MKLWQIILIVLVLRLISLNQSLWLDEAVSAKVVKSLNYSEIIKKFSPGDFHPPLYYLTLKSWTNIFGYSEVSLRMPSIIFSLVTVVVVYQLAGAWPALLTGVNPLLLYYSQEARMYSMVTMLLTLAVYCFVKRKHFWFNVWAGLSLLTFYGSIFLLAALGLYLILKRDYRRILISFIGPAMVLVVLWPLIQTQMINSQEMLLEVKNWSLVLGKANIKNLILIPIKFTSGRISLTPKIIFFGITGLWMSYVFWSVGKNSLKNKFWGYLFWVTLGVGVVFSIFTPLLQYFRFLYLIPIMAILIGRNKLIAVGFTIFSLVYLLTPLTWREDWKTTVMSLNRYRPLYIIGSVSDPVIYYRQDLLIRDIKSIRPTEPEIQVIPYAEAIHGFDHNGYLKSFGYIKTGESDFREVTSETWKKSTTFLEQ